MNCKEFNRAVNQDRRPFIEQTDEASAHLRECAKCRESFAVDSLADSLLKAYSAKSSMVAQNYDNPYMMTRIRARIREMSDQGVSSWEAAVIALRGWLVGFGAVALLLLTLSMQWQWSGPSPVVEQENDIMTLANFNEDYIGRSEKPGPVKNEDVGYAHK